MLKENLNQLQTIPNLKKLQLEGDVTLHIPTNVLNQIKYLCREVSTVEWSGILFYEVKGSIKNIEKLKLIAKHILPMDIGTEAETEFNWGGSGDEPIVTYLMTHDEAENWKMGHIHSHHNMRTFFFWY